MRTYLEEFHNFYQPWSSSDSYSVSTLNYVAVFYIIKKFFGISFSKWNMEKKLYANLYIFLLLYTFSFPQNDIAKQVTHFNRSAGR